MDTGKEERPTVKGLSENINEELVRLKALLESMFMKDSTLKAGIVGAPIEEASNVLDEVWGNLSKAVGKIQDLRIFIEEQIVNKLG